MPINIYNRKAEENNDKIAWLCDDSWDLTEQMYALEDWLKEKGKDLPKGDYVADVGIRARKDFNEGIGGGVAFPPEAMVIMAEKGMYLFISEYPDSEE